MKITLKEILAEAATFAAMTPEERDFVIESLNEEDRQVKGNKKSYKNLCDLVGEARDAIRGSHYPLHHPSVESEYLVLALESLEEAERHLLAAERHGRVAKKLV